MYFSVVPNIVYDEKPIKYPFSDADRVIAKNFFRRYKLNDDVFSYAVFFNKERSIFYGFFRNRQL